MSACPRQGLRSSACKSSSASRDSARADWRESRGDAIFDARRGDERVEPALAAAGLSGSALPANPPPPLAVLARPRAGLDPFWPNGEGGAIPSGASSPRGRPTRPASKSAPECELRVLKSGSGRCSSAMAHGKAKGRVSRAPRGPGRPSPGFGYWRGKTRRRTIS